MRRLPLPMRRTALRHAVRIACQVVRERDFTLVADEIMDLSADGMRVGPSDPVLTGERLIATFQLPTDGYWIDVEATVSRVLHGRRPGEITRSLGLIFDHIPGFSQFLLERALKSIPVAPPNGRSGRRAVRIIPALFRPLPR
jgi:hypothetical protein